MKIPGLALGRRRNSHTPTPPSSMLTPTSSSSSSPPSSPTPSASSSTRMGRSKSQRGMGKWNRDAIEPTITEGRRGLASSDSPSSSSSSSSSSSTSSSSSPHAPVILKRKERSKSQRGLDKWKDQLSAEDQQVLALTTAVRRDRSNPSTPRLAQAPPPTSSAEDRPDGGVCSPRWLDDSADDSVKRYRTGAQINAMASLYAVNPAVFS